MLWKGEMDLDGCETGLKYKGHVHNRYVLSAISEPEFG
jgi:hypothetical protein